jgi:hypothetical protein
VREGADVIRSENQLRQIALGLHHYAEANDGNLPGCVEGHLGQGTLGTQALLPYIEQDALYHRIKDDPAETFGGLLAPVRLYENPLDPTRGMANSIAGSGEIDRLGVCSYPWNAQALGVLPTLSSATDGLSQTIWIAEHYAWNCGGTAFLSEGGMVSSWAAQPATFAHGGTIPGRPAPGDYVPITSGDPPVSRAADGKTFQVRPKVAECDPRLPNATSTRGLQVAFGDGSVRILGPGIAPEIFWSAVTPSGGELLAIP